MVEIGQEGRRDRACKVSHCKHGSSAVGSEDDLEVIDLAFGFIKKTWRRHGLVAHHYRTLWFVRGFQFLEFGQSTDEDMQVLVERLMDLTFEAFETGEDFFAELRSVFDGKETAIFDRQQETYEGLEQVEDIASDELTVSIEGGSGRE